jgi:hypothetical protein
MKMKKFVRSLVAVAACGFAASAAYAYTIDELGEGFVGKGEVQIACGLNNRGLQQAEKDGLIFFRASSVSGTEITWECTNDKNENIQERSRTTTVTTEGLVSHTARERNQFTGFTLDGYNGSVIVGDSVTEGPKVDSCPSGPWELTRPAGDPVALSPSDSVVSVSCDGGENYTDLE